MGEEQLEALIISEERAWEKVWEVVTTIGVEELALEGAVGRYTCEPIVSPLNLPPFNRSAMDGYACRKEGLPGPFKVLGEIAAGDHLNLDLNSNECVKVMTGARVPGNADCVLKLEDVCHRDGMVYGHQPVRQSHIVEKGREMKSGDVIVDKGVCLGSAHIGCLAAGSISHVKVFRKPAVGIISSGTELLDVGSSVEEGKIFNSSAPQLSARLGDIGLKPHYYGNCPDNYTQLKDRMQKALERCDLLIVTGGVSVGDYDYVPSLVKDLGFVIHFSKLKARPGKHTLFASASGKYILGLPGNPVSTFVQFEYCGRSIIEAMYGRRYRPLRLEMQMTFEYCSHTKDVLELLPVAISDSGCLAETGYQGSGHIQALMHARAFLEIPEGVSKLNIGEKVYVRLLTSKY